MKEAVFFLCDAEKYLAEQQPLHFLSGKSSGRDLSFRLVSSKSLT